MQVWVYTFGALAVAAVIVWALVDDLRLMIPLGALTLLVGIIGSLLVAVRAVQDSLRP